MISEALRRRALYGARVGTAHERLHNPEVKILINRAVRKVVMLMAALEKHGVMTREQIEDCVLREFEKAEYLYYGLQEHELMTAVDKEIKNDKRRKRNSKSL